MEVDTRVWQKNKNYKDPDRDELWIPSSVVSKEEDDRDNFELVSVMDKEGIETEYKLPIGHSETDNLKMRNPPVYKEVDNLVNLLYINEPEILFSLKRRYADSLIYTMTGPIMIVVNPLDYTRSSVESEEVLTGYVRGIKAMAIKNVEDELGVIYDTADGDAAALSGSSTTQPQSQQTMAPHLSFAQYSKPALNNNHSILISGETGSGKTESSKNLIKALLTESRQALLHATSFSTEDYAVVIDKVSFRYSFAVLYILIHIRLVYCCSILIFITLYIGFSIALFWLVLGAIWAHRLLLV